LRKLAVVGILLAVGTTAMANTVQSSTMWFQGTLQDEGGGVYTGVLACVNEEAAGIGDGVGGFDIYGKEGAKAWFGNDPGSGAVWKSETISDHDGWPDWNPDTPDWYQYSVEFYVEGGQTKWALRNHAGATEENPWYDSFWNTNSNIGQPKGVPMSGSMDWATMIATETDVGEYLPGTLTPEIPDGAAGYGGGAGAWDMDWSWGSEVVPLQYSDLKVEVTEIGNGYLVSMTPVPEPLTMMTLFGSVAALGAYIRKRRAA